MWSTPKATTSETSRKSSSTPVPAGSRMPSYRLAAFSAWEKSCSQFRSARSCTTRRRTNTYLMLPRNDWRRRLGSTRNIGRPCQMNNGTATCTSTTSARRIGNSAPFRVSQIGPAGEDVTQSLLPGYVFPCKKTPAEPEGVALFTFSEVFLVTHLPPARLRTRWLAVHTDEVYF